jgi:hypothetical protein
MLIVISAVVVYRLFLFLRCWADCFLRLGKEVFDPNEKEVMFSCALI